MVMWSMDKKLAIKGEELLKHSLTVIWTKDCLCLHLQIEDFFKNMT
jgi:hypothetical protein